MPIDTDFYFKFNSFSYKSSIIQYGKLENKSEGYNFSPSQINLSEKIPENRLKDTTISTMKTFYFDSTIRVFTGQDSIYAKIFFQKNANIFTIHRIYKSGLIHGKYSLSGFYYHFIDQDVSILETMENIRPLTKQEKKICGNMVEKIYDFKVIKN